MEYNELLNKLVKVEGLIYEASTEVSGLIEQDLTTAVQELRGIIESLLKE